MTKILNLDKLQTKREKAIILDGKEHVMKVFTVKEYIFHMREAEKLVKLDEDSIDTLGAGLDATVNILLNAFPTVTREQFEGLNMEQLDAIRGLVDTTADEEAEVSEEGEVTGKAETAE
jgi:hypothetical protein